MKKKITSGDLVDGAVKSIKSSRPYATLFEGIGITEEECKSHLSALHELQPHQENTFAHNYLYSCLSILDEKSHALLTYDAIVLAAASLALTVFTRNVTAGSVLIFIALVLSALAASLCLSVIWIYWTETAEFQKDNGLFLQLLHIRNRRTIAYRLSWCISQMAMVSLVIGVIVDRVS